MTLVAEKTYTPQDLLDDPNLAGYELVDGHLRERPVSERSSAVAAAIGSLLRNEAKKRREATVYSSDLGYQCFADSPNTLRFPDVSLVRTSRKGDIGEDPVTRLYRLTSPLKCSRRTIGSKKLTRKSSNISRRVLARFGSSIRTGGTFTSIAQTAACSCLASGRKSRAKSRCRAFGAR
jgi:hypothetical protein